MAKKKVEEVKVEETVGTTDVETTVEVTKFPYTVKLRSIGTTITVVAESTDANGKLLLVSKDGCTYHAE